MYAIKLFKVFFLLMSSFQGNYDGDWSPSDPLNLLKFSSESDAEEKWLVKESPCCEYFMLYLLYFRGVSKSKLAVECDNCKVELMHKVVRALNALMLCMNILYFSTK